MSYFQFSLFLLVLYICGTQSMPNPLDKMTINLNIKDTDNADEKLESGAYDDEYYGGPAYPEYADGDYHYQPEYIAGKVYPIYAAPEVQPEYIAGKVYPIYAAPEVQPEYIAGKVYPIYAAQEVQPEYIAGKVYPIYA